MSYLLPRSLTRIRTLHERSKRESGGLRHETWSLVEIDGERKVLFEARDGVRSEEAQPVDRRLMTLREALREPREIARNIWLSLED